MRLVQRTVKRLSSSERTFDGPTICTSTLSDDVSMAMAGAVTVRALGCETAPTTIEHAPSAVGRSNRLVMEVDPSTWVSVGLTVVAPHASCTVLVAVKPVPATVTAVGAGEPANTDAGVVDAMLRPGLVAVTLTVVGVDEALRSTT